MKKKYFILIIILYVASLVSCISTYSIKTVGWGNGNFFTKANPYAYSYSANYGTHDWIAESSLETLYAKVTSGKSKTFLNDLKSNTNNLKNYFFVGTEILDYRVTVAGRAGFNIKTKCDRTITHNDIPTYPHELRFNGKELSTQFRRLCIDAQNMAKKASTAFIERDTQKAAFFLGCMVHYISDATFYTHVYNNINSHANFKNRVNFVTDNMYVDSDIYRMSEFFNIKEAYDHFTESTKKDPFEAAKLCGLDTRYGNMYQLSFTSAQYKDALFLDDYCPSSGNGQFWQTPLASGNDNWDSNNRPTLSGNEKDYFDTIEHNLNTAVYYCAVAMNLIMDDYNGKDCAGDGGQHNPIDPLGGDIGDKVGVKVKQYSFLFFWQFLGMMSTLTALTVIKQLKVIAPYLF